MSLCGPADEGIEVIEVPAGEVAVVFEAGDRFCSVHEIDGEVFDNGHVLRAVAGPQAGEIVAEDDIKHPMDPVFDAPMGAPPWRRLRTKLGHFRGRISGDIETVATKPAFPEAFRWGRRCLVPVGELFE